MATTKTFVDLGDEGRLDLDWDRLDVWRSWDERDSHGPHTFWSTYFFFDAVKNEIRHASTKRRMQEWMQKHGNRIVRESFEERMSQY